MSEPLITSALPSILQMDSATAAGYDATADCTDLHNRLIAAAGAAQSAFFCLECVQRDADAMGRLSMAQFRSFVHVSESPSCLSKACDMQSVAHDFSAESCDEIFLNVVTDAASMERKNECEATASMDLKDFVFAIVHVASR